MYRLFMVIFQYNLYIFWIHFWTVLYPKPCYNESCYKEVVVYKVEHQWLEQFWDHENLFDIWVVRATKA